MPTTIWMTRGGSRLEPTAEWCEDALREIPEGVELRVQITRDRSRRQLKTYWALCAKVAAMLRAMGKEQADRDYVSDCYKAATGYCEAWPLPLRLRHMTGHTIGIRTTSIAIDRMDQEQFNRFMNAILAYTVTDLLPNVPLRELRAEVDALLEKISREKERQAD